MRTKKGSIVRKNAKKLDLGFNLTPELSSFFNRRVLLTLKNL